MLKSLITEGQRRAPKGMYLPCIYEHKSEVNPHAVREVLQLAEPTSTVAQAKAALVRYAHRGSVRVYDDKGGYYTSSGYEQPPKAAATPAPVVTPRK